MAIRAGGRDFPGRLSFALDGVGFAGAAASVALVLLTRVPFRTRYLLNWDADQFALGMAHFDVVHHQPHPPGYPAYVLLGRLLLPLFGDANSALVALSIAGECAGVALAFLLARSLFGTFAGAVTAAAMVSSPLFWYYGEAANTYALEPALTLVVAWFAWRAWNGDRGAAVPAALALAAGGALRPSMAVLLAPLVLVALLRLGDVGRFAIAAAVGALATAAWAVPLVIATGGLGAYWHASTALGSDVTSSTAIWSAGPAGLLTTSDAVLRGTVWELGAFGVVALYGLLVAPRLGVPTGLPAGYAAFAWTWTLPGLLTFLFVHIGQVVYVQVFLPAVLLALGPALTAMARALGRPQWRLPIAAACAAAGVLIFMLPPRTSLLGQLQQHDRWVDELVATVAAEDPEHTVLVADAYAVGSYRTAQVYLPEYRRVAVARDRTGELGEVFGDVYMPERLDGGAGPLVLPPGTDTVVFVDRSVVDAYVADPERLRTVRLPDGSRIYVWHGDRPELRGGWIWLGPGYQDRRGLAP